MVRPHGGPQLELSQISPTPMKTPPTVDPNATPDDLPDDAKNQVVDWFEATTNEERFEWANSARGSHDALQLMMEVNTTQRDRQLQNAKEKAKSEMTKREKHRLIREEGPGAYAARPDTPGEEDGSYTDEEVMEHVREHGRHPAFDDDDTDELLEYVREHGHHPAKG